MKIDNLFIIFILHVCFMSCRNDYSSEQKNGTHLINGTDTSRQPISLNDLGSYFLPVEIVSVKRLGDSSRYKLDFIDTLGTDGADAEAIYYKGNILNADVTFYGEMGKKVLNFKFDSEGVKIESFSYVYTTSNRMEITDKNVVLDSQYFFYWRWNAAQTKKVDTPALQILNNLLNTLPKGSNIPLGKNR